MSDLRISAYRPQPLKTATPARPNPLKEFGDAIRTALEKVDQTQKDADGSIMELLNGEASIHETMVATQKADISMRLLLAVRNKAVDAYKEIMRMQF